MAWLNKSAAVLKNPARTPTGRRMVLPKPSAGSHAGDENSTILWINPVKIPRALAILAVAMLMVGCTRWDSKPGNYVGDTNAMADVVKFVSIYGWNSSTNEGDLHRWENLPPHYFFQPHYIHDLPWSALRNKQFQALTHGGILYVLSDAEPFNYWGGIAYNPQTNRFPAREGICFKPIGEHWYVWAIWEASAGANMPRIYE